MATLNIEIMPTAARSDGRRRVRIRLTHHRALARIDTPYRLHSSDITPRGKIKDETVRRRLASDIAVMEEHLSTLGVKADNYTARELGDVLGRAVKIKAGVATDVVDLFIFGYEVAADMKALQPRQSDNYVSLLRKVSQYIGGDRLNINNITRRWLIDFEAAMINSKLSETTVNNNLRLLRAIYNRARDKYNDEERGIVILPYYPFGANKFKIITPPPTKSRAVNISTVRAVYNYKPLTVREELARDVFIFSFAMMGINAADLYCCEVGSYCGGRLVYARAKVKGKRGSDAEISVNIPAICLYFFHKYTSSESCHQFNFAQRFSTVNCFSAAVNKGLKSISKSCNIEPLTLYYARHTFATVAHNDCGASISEVGACLNHAPTSDKVTRIYVRKNFDRNDQIQSAVVNLLLAQ